MRFRIHRAACPSRSTQALVTSGLLTLAPISGVAQPATAPVQRTCAADEARSTVGQSYSPELAEQARRAAGARGSARSSLGAPTRRISTPTG